MRYANSSRTNTRMYQFLRKQETRNYISKRADLTTLHRKNPFLPTFPNKAATVSIPMTREFHFKEDRDLLYLFKGVKENIGATVSA